VAEFERAVQEAKATGGGRGGAVCGPAPAVFCDVAEVEGTSGPEVVGFALWFLNFSTWLGRHGIYLEDLYVQPAHRGGGLGRALLQGLARRCVEQGYGRLEWSVLDWNEPAIGFYEALGAVQMDEWTVHRLTGDALTALGTPPSPAS
jgi:GNAT superfamily N-acetyltransferase